MERFSIPVVLFIFKRIDTTLKIVEQIKKIKPYKMYLIADGPRNNDESIEVDNCRKAVEEAITWDCEIIRNYSISNVGIYDRIGLGAKWVFTLEKWAIFLEDDNFPELSFFEYCKDLLIRYEKLNSILWINGTNYLGEYKDIKTSYIFTQHLLPCGWASWSSKYNEYYIGDLSYLENEQIIKDIKATYENKKLFKQQLFSIQSEYDQIKKNKSPRSWDYHMAMSIKINNLFGISPKFNLIKNIGVDANSTHGGNSMKNTMTKRFCEVDTKSLEFPLIHPKYLMKNSFYESKIGKIILYPISIRIKSMILLFIKKILKVNKFDSLRKKVR